MNKSQNIALVTLALLSTAACAPTSQSFLDDASATCGSPNLLDATRTFQQTTSTQEVDRIYGCVDAYRRNLPEYSAMTPNVAADNTYVQQMHAIDLARASGQLTPAQAQAQAQAAANAHGALNQHR